MTRRWLDAKGTIGRADLALALATAVTDADRETLAKILGFEVARRVVSPVIEAPQQGEPPGEPPVPRSRIDRRERPPTPFWRVTQVARVSVPERPSPGPPRALRPARRITDYLGPDPEAPPPSTVPPLAPWARLRRAMEQLVHRLRPVGEVDVDAVVERVGRGEPLQRLPRHERRTRSPRLVVVIDRAERLVPFWGDQLDVYWNLRDELGGAAMEHAWWVDGPPQHASEVALAAAVAPGLEAGDVVLVLGDLGSYGPPALQQAWALVGEVLGRHGVVAAALVPTGTAGSDWVRGVWHVVAWERPDRDVERAERSPAVRQRRSEQLLALLSWTVRIEPELLRAVRMQLPPDEADAQTEADAWNHPRVGRHPAGLLVPHAERLAWQDELVRNMLGETRWQDVLRRVVAVVRAWHRPLARELWLDEARSLESLAGGSWISDDERAQVEELTVILREHAKAREDERPGLGATLDVRGWLRRSLKGQHWKALEGTERGALMLETWDAVEPPKERDLPVGMLARMLPVGADVQERRFVVGQLADCLCVAAEGVAVDPRMSPLVTVAARARWLQVGSKLHALEEEGVRRIPLPEGEAFEIATDCVKEIELRLESKPAWAEAMGRDREGLWLEYRGHRLDWPSWAREVGEDELGAWATFLVGEVEQRMRWIAPGTFVMGSPESEEGHYEDEGPQHEVTLTEGYWLADTPCTQAMWQAVMGDNPSQYQSTRRPVEQVTWDDVQGFLAKLNEAAPGLNAGLPSEAQWEYACRAGTTTATYAGDLRILGDNNAPLLDDIAWYGGNSGVGYELEQGSDSTSWPNKQHAHTRAGTREVGLKRPNPWGLYDMLGNVLEWCADMPRDYTTAAETDPQGTRGPERVARGGGWIGGARFVRAALRRWFVPGDRDGFLGFRLVRGQDLRKQAKPATRQQGREQGRGTSPASPGGRGKKGV